MSTSSGSQLLAWPPRSTLSLFTRGPSPWSKECGPQSRRVVGFVSIPVREFNMARSRRCADAHPVVCLARPLRSLSDRVRVVRTNSRTGEPVSGLLYAGAGMQSANEPRVAID